MDNHQNHKNNQYFQHQQNQQQSRQSQQPPQQQFQNTGVRKQLLKAGDGKTYPKHGQSVTVHYAGFLTNGKKFDSSVGKQPFTFNIGIGQVIRGWDEGVLGMSLGEICNLEISSEYGYGARGAPPDIPPYATLIFQVQLLGIK